MVAVDAAAEHFNAALLELLNVVRERQDLRGAHESEVEGVEEQDDVLAALERRQGQALGLAVGHDGINGEVGGGLLDERHVILRGRFRRRLALSLL